MLPKLTGNFDRVDAGLRPPGLLVAAIRLALVLQQTGRPVVLGRADVLSYLFLAFGIAGIERGLGRAHGFRLSDFE